MIWKADDMETEAELVEALKTLEDGGQATVDELKEPNLRTNEDPYPVYVSTMLTPEEQGQYFQLLSEYRDCLLYTSDAADE